MLRINAGNYYLFDELVYLSTSECGNYKQETTNNF